jgi:membrane associated rhomboid family serine protease
MLDEARTFRITPWVGRLMAAELVSVLLLSTIFTAPRFADVLTLIPGHLATRPWTAVTYLFVHESLLHFALSVGMLFVFGPPVERKLGSRKFLTLFFAAGIGAALFTAAMAQFLQIPPVVGPSGALFGIAMAFALSWPNAELSGLLVRIPVTVQRGLFAILTVDMVLGVLNVRAGIAHLTHVGGAATGYLLLWLNSLTTKRAPARAPSMARRPVVTPMQVEATATELRPASTPIRDRPAEPNGQDVDRVLDKIAQFGMESLTTQERKFLADVSERKRREQQ